MIGRAMETWPDEALQRVADATAMCAGTWTLGDVGCLLSVAFGGELPAYEALGRPTVDRLVARFDRLAIAYIRLNLTVRHARVPVEVLRVMCANRARKILATRALNALLSVSVCTVA